MSRLATIVLLFAVSSVSLGEDKPPKEGSYYKYGELGVRKTTITGNQVKMVFKPKDEQFYWCPGIKIQHTKKATIILFVRCKTSENWNVDQKATIGKKLIRTVQFNTNGKDVYVREGAKKFKRIYKAPMTEEEARKAAAAKKNKGKSQAGSGKRTTTQLTPSSRK